MFGGPSIHTAIRQTERWLIAARQDRHPAIAMLHANYAVGNVDLIRQIWTDQEIVAATGKDINEIHKQAVAAQDAASKQLFALAPQVRPMEE